MSFGAVIVETRERVDLPRIIEQHMEKLPSDWGLTVFTSALNEIQVKQNFPDARVIDVGKRVLTIRGYSLLLTSLEFWGALPYEKVLVFQPDSRLLRSGIDEFLKWDYVGAPWKFQDHGGNGGLSLRTNSIMQAIIKVERYNPFAHGEEDIYFSNRVIAAGGKLAPREVCLKFSCEAIYQLGTLGCHAIERYLTADEVHSILNQYSNKQPNSHRRSLRLQTFP
jgi:Protein of unknown function (DUF5672)